VSASTRPLADVAELRHVLTQVLDRLERLPGGGDYRLVGTAAALLHGVPVPAGDIDLLFADRTGVDRFARALSPYRRLHRPSWLPEAQQYFAEYVVEGIGVSASTVEQGADVETHECVGPAPWRHYNLLACGRHVVPTVILELRLLSELRRNRPDRIRPLAEHLHRHGYDLELVERGMAELELPIDQRRAVLDDLAAMPRP
jgi:hypothetical protein